MNKKLTNLATTLLLLATLFIVITNLSSKPSSLVHDSLTRPDSKIMELSIARPILDAETRDKFKASGYFEDLLEFQGITPLETTDDSIFGEISDMVTLDDRFVIGDRLTSAIYQFDLEGHFINRFGKEGQGPGEFASVRSLQPCYDNMIGVADPAQGHVHLFKLDGQFVKASPLHYDDKLYLVSRGFAWPKADRFYISAFNTAHAKAPLHVILDPSDPSHPRVVSGFGSRIDSLQKAYARGSGVRSHSAFKLIGDRIWSGSPYTTHINLFDLEGHQVAELGKDIPRDPETFIQPEDYEDIHRKADPDLHMRTEIVPKHSNRKILPLGSLVLVQVGNVFDIYDRGGNLIVANRKLKGEMMPWFSDGKQQILRVYIPGMPLEEAGDQEIQEQLAPYTPERGDHNPVLLRYTFKAMQEGA